MVPQKNDNRRHIWQTQLPSTFFAADKNALLLSGYLPTNIFTIRYIDKQMLASEVSYTSLRLIVDSSLNSRDLLASKIPTQAIRRAAGPAAMPCSTLTSKQMPSLKDHRSGYPPIRMQLEWWCNHQKWANRLAWSSCLCQWTTRRWVFTITQIGDPPNPPTKMMKIVGKI